MVFWEFWIPSPPQAQRTLNAQDLKVIETNKKIIQTATVLTAVTVILQGSAVTNLNSTHQIQALVISVRLSFFLNAAACFAAAENILAIVNKGYNVVEAREALRIAILFVFGGAIFFLITTCFWMWMHVLWAKVVTLLTILSLSGWALHNIVKG